MEHSTLPEADLNDSVQSADASWTQVQGNYRNIENSTKILVDIFIGSILYS